MDLQNKVVIVTGGVGGLGFVTVQHLLRNGVEYVAIFDLVKSDSDVVVNAMKKLEQEFDKGKFGYYICNVVNVEEFTACYKEVLELKNYVDILVNSAGILNDKNPTLAIDVNFKAIVSCTLVAIEHMGKHKGYKGGVVVNIASIYGVINTSTIPIYSATKHAVVSFVRSMKEHNDSLGVRIVCICPGRTVTNMTATGKLRDISFDFVPQKMIDEHAKIPLQKSDTVALAIIEIIERGKEGAVWITQNDEPPFAVVDVEDLGKLSVPF